MLGGVRQTAPTLAALGEEKASAFAEPAQAAHEEVNSPATIGAGRMLFRQKAKGRLSYHPAPLEADEQNAIVLSALEQAYDRKVHQFNCTTGKLPRWLLDKDFTETAAALKRVGACPTPNSFALLLRRCGVNRSNAAQPFWAVVYLEYLLGVAASVDASFHLRMRAEFGDKRLRPGPLKTRAKALSRVTELWPQDLLLLCGDLEKMYAPPPAAAAKIVPDRKLLGSYGLQTDLVRCTLIATDATDASNMIRRLRVFAEVVSVGRESWRPPLEAWSACANQASDIRVIIKYHAERDMLEVCRPELAHNDALIQDQEDLSHLCEVRIITRPMATCRLLLKTLYLFRRELPEPTREGEIRERFEEEARSAMMDGRKARGEGYEKPLPAMPEGFEVGVGSHEHFIAEAVLQKTMGAGMYGGDSIEENVGWASSSYIVLGSRHGEVAGRCRARRTTHA